MVSLRGCEVGGQGGEMYFAGRRHHSLSGDMAALLLRWCLRLLKGFVLVFVPSRKEKDRSEFG